jgi:hypothetical protein
MVDHPNESGFERSVALRHRPWLASPRAEVYVGPRAESEFMIPTRLLWASCVLVVGAAEGCAPRSTGSSPGAALAGAAALVSANAVNRAVTGACWGQCSGGKVCDKESGLCVAVTCDPACRQDQVCEKLSVGFTCVPRSTANPSAQNSAPSADGETDPEAKGGTEPEAHGKTDPQAQGEPAP